jgi:T5SS/PEP-CTERM-associated repeat protein
MAAGDGLRVGIGGSGNVILEGGSTALSQDITTIGGDRSGSLSVAGGSAFTSSFAMYLGDQAGGRGTVNVDGIGSTLTVVDNVLEVGYRDEGTLNVGSGAAVHARAVVIGRFADGFGQVFVNGDGTGSITTTQSLVVGDDGRGELTLGDRDIFVSGPDDEDSGRVFVGLDAVLGDSSAAAGDFGQIRVNGDGSLLDISRDLQVVRGFASANRGGRIDVADDIFIHGATDGDLSVSAFSDVEGVVSEVTAGDVIIAGTSNAGAQVIAFGGGQITAGTSIIARQGNIGLGGGAYVAPQVIVEADGSISRENVLATGDTTVLTGDLLVHGRAALDTATLEIDGDLTLFQDAAFEIELDASKAFGQVRATGSASVAGQLSLAGLMHAEAGDSLAILEADGGVTGTFAEVTPNGLGQGLTLSVIYEATAVRVAIEAALLTGDFDGNGSVGAGDLALVLANWGAAVAEGQAPDPNWANPAAVTASNIGADELALVLSQWGNSSPIESSLAQITEVTGLTEAQTRALVPEPSAGAIVLSLAGGLGFRRRRDRSAA